MKIKPIKHMDKDRRFLYSHPRGPGRKTKADKFKAIFEKEIRKNESNKAKENI